MFDCESGSDEPGVRGVPFGGLSRDLNAIAEWPVPLDEGVVPREMSVRILCMNTMGEGEDAEEIERTRETGTEVSEVEMVRRGLGLGLCSGTSLLPVSASSPSDI